MPAFLERCLLPPPTYTTHTLRGSTCSRLRELRVKRRMQPPAVLVSRQPTERKACVLRAAEGRGCGHLQQAAGVEVEQAHAAVSARGQQAPLVVVEGQSGQPGCAVRLREVPLPLPCVQVPQAHHPALVPAGHLLARQHLRLYKGLRRVGEGQGSARAALRPSTLKPLAPGVQVPWAGPRRGKACRGGHATCTAAMQVQ